jgi:MFS family permease
VTGIDVPLNSSTATELGQTVPAAHHPSGQHPTLTLAILATVSLAYSLLQSLVAPMIRTFQLELNTTPTGAAWIISAFLLSSAVSTPVFGRLGDMYGKKRMILVSLSVMAFGTLVSALASSIGPMIAGRAIQGVGAAVFPLAFGIIRDEFPREQAMRGIALISGVLGVGGGLGIGLAGPIAEHLSYHALFWIPFGGIAAAGVAAVAFIPESPVRACARIDVLGGVLLAAWLIALLVGVSEGQSWGWGSTTTLSTFAAAALLLSGWVAFEARTAEPMVDMQMMRLRGVWTANLVAGLGGFAVFGAFFLIPHLMQLPQSSGFGQGASVSETSLTLVPLPIGIITASFVAGRLAPGIGARTPMLIGSILGAVGLALLAEFHGSQSQLIPSVFLLGVACGFAWASAPSMVIESVASTQVGIATGMNLISRTIGAAIGSQVVASIVAGSLDPSRATDETDFIVSFWLVAGIFAIGIAASLAAPSSRRRSYAGAPADQAAAIVGALRTETKPSSSP